MTHFYLASVGGGPGAGVGPTFVPITFVPVGCDRALSISALATAKTGTLRNTDATQGY